jgi:hypothetical protein
VKHCNICGLGQNSQVLAFSGRLIYEGEITPRTKLERRNCDVTCIGTREENRERRAQAAGSRRNITPAGRFAYGSQPGIGGDRRGERESRHVRARARPSCAWAAAPRWKQAAGPTQRVWPSAAASPAR